MVHFVNTQFSAREKNYDVVLIQAVTNKYYILHTVYQSNQNNNVEIALQSAQSKTSKKKKQIRNKKKQHRQKRNNSP